MADIKCYTYPKIEVRQGPIGLGTFAKEDIKKDEVVFIKAGHIVQVEEALRYDKEVGDYSVQITDDFFLCPKKIEEIPDLVIHFNHSCNPNVGPDGQVSFVALRDIKKGEELSVDYATIVSHKYRLECKCGSKECRKIITGDDWKLKELQDKYGNHFSWFILKKIKGF